MAPKSSEFTGIKGLNKINILQNYVISMGRKDPQSIEELSESEKMVILLTGYSKESKPIRLQKLSLLTKAILEGKVPTSHGAYLFGGFSDEIAENSESLRSEGYLTYRGGEGYSLTKDGMKLYNVLLQKERKLSIISDKVVQTFREISDQELTAITYKFFPELTSNSIIKKKMERIGRNLNIETFELKEILDE